MITALNQIYYLFTYLQQQPFYSHYTSQPALEGIPS